MEAPPLERRLAAILAADVEGYSRLMHGDEEATMAALSARRALVDELIARYRGRIANTAGDSVLAEFASVLDAIRCAVEIQQALEQANDAEPEGRRMRFRIGVNVGDVMVKDGDIFGDGVNVAARLEGLVRGGEICVSRGVHDHLRHRGGMSSRIWASSWSRTSPTRSGRFGSASVRIHPGKRSRLPRKRLEEPELPSAPPAISELSADNEVALELALWDSVKDGSPAELETYLEQYPQGTFASLARTRMMPPCTRRPTPGADPRRRRRRPARSRFLGVREGQRSMRRAAGLSGPASKRPFCRARPGPPFFTRRDLVRVCSHGIASAQA